MKYYQNVLLGILYYVILDIFSFFINLKYEVFVIIFSFSFFMNLQISGAKSSGYFFNIYSIYS